MELGELLQVIEGGTARDHVPRHNEFPLALMRPDEEWCVIGCPGELRDALAGASEADLARYAVGWAESEELNMFHWDKGELTSTLNDLLSALANLTRQAQARNESLYLWICP